MVFLLGIYDCYKRRIPGSWLKQGFWQGGYGKDAIKYKGLKEKGFLVNNGVQPQMA